MLRYLRCAVAGVPVVLFATVVSAQVAPQSPASATAVPPAVAATDPAVPSAGAAPQALSAEELGNESGRQGIYIYAGANQNLTATNSGNSITADTVGSGNITLAEGAFAGFAGIGNFVINSGHNNNLQGSLSIIIVTP
jgi:hypothetical protein